MIYNFDFAPAKNFVEKNHPGRGVLAQPARGQSESQRERNCVQRHPSSRPSPQVEGETSAVSLKKRAAGLVGWSVENTKTCQGGPFSWGEKARMRAVIKPLFASPESEPHFVPSLLCCLKIPPSVAAAMLGWNFRGRPANSARAIVRLSFGHR